MSNLSRLELLSKDNYDTWILQMEAILVKADLFDYVSGCNNRPNENDENLYLWIKNDKKAKAEIILAISPSELKQVKDCDTSRDVWLKLEKIYASKGPARKANLLKQLMMHKLDEGGNIKDHIATFFDIVDKLESMNVSINGDMLTIMLLYSLPPLFENFRCAIETRDELPSAESLKIKILEENEARKQFSENSVIALNADTPKKSFNKSKLKSKLNFKCFKCGKIGHKANVCYSKIKNHTKETAYSAFTIESANKVNNDQKWILDSGCTTHLCADLESFVKINKDDSTKVNLANHSNAEVQGKGIVSLNLQNNCGNQVLLQNTLLVPDLRNNLISVAKITDKGHKVIFTKENARVYNKRRKLTMIADRIGNLFYARQSHECLAASSENDDLVKWHNRLGHLNVNDVIRMFRDKLLIGESSRYNGKNFACDICLKGKMTSTPFIKSNKPCEETLNIVHSDVVGPFRNTSYDGCRYFVTFIDDCSRWCEVYFIKQKSDVFEAFKTYKRTIEKQIGKHIKCLQSDNGGEYVNEEFNKYLVHNGIRRRLTIPYTPQQNGVAERLNRTLLDMTRCLLLQTGLDSSFWSVCVATACHIRNRCPTSSLNYITPFEKIFNRKPNLQYLRTFGSKVVILDKTPNKNKLSLRGIEGIFVGYPKDRKGYRVWIPSERKMLFSRDVKFLNESVKSVNLSNDQNAFKHSNKIKNDEKYVEFYEEISSENVENENIEIENIESENIESENIESENNEQNIQFNEYPEENNHHRECICRGPGRPKILRTGARGRPRKVYCTKNVNNDIIELNEENEILHNNANNDGQEIELNEENEVLQNSNEERDDDNNNTEDFAGIVEFNIQDAINGSDKNEWLDAIESEVTSLIKNKTWEVVKETNNKDVIGCRLILTNKCDDKGNIVRRKARLVAQGYSQKYGINYNETFAPVARLETLRLLLALSIKLKFKIWQFDVVTAYLNGDLNEKVTMKIPEMLGMMLERIINKQGEKSEIGTTALKMQLSLREGGNACILKKALYGLKQAGRQWYAKLSEKLKKIGFKCMKNEPCLFIKRIDEDLVLLLVYVDDILIATREPKVVFKIKYELMKDFELKDLGLAKYCLGLQIEQSENEIKLKQTSYINQLLKMYGMYECNPVSTPAEVNKKFIENNESYTGNNYRELIGALMYLTVATRPDISNTISRLAQFVNNPSKENWNALKRVLRYLKGTADIGLNFRKTEDILTAFTDADWGGCTSDRHSYTGYVFILSGGAISWKSQKQRTVALSSTEAEYVSLTEAAKEAIYLRSLLEEIGLQEFANIKIFVDNRGAEMLASNHVFHARTKHIDIKHHFIREAIEEKHFVLKHVPTKNMVADILTKPLVRISHNRCLEGMGISK